MCRKSLEKVTQGDLEVFILPEKKEMEYISLQVLIDPLLLLYVCIGFGMCMHWI